MYKLLLLVCKVELLNQTAIMLCPVTFLRTVEDSLTTRSSLDAFCRLTGQAVHTQKRGSYPFPPPQPAHLHALDVLKHDIPDSLVISSDVRI